MMKRLVKLQKDSQGFTLVELMIVVAIIGILAAIAIPQFAAYRIRGYNASALSDLKGLSTTQAAYFADFAGYGVTAAAPVIALTAGGGVLTGPILPANALTSGLHQFLRAADQFLGLPLGNGVSIVANSDVASAQSFTAVSKNQKGDSWYGVDGDVSNLFIASGKNTDVTLVMVAADTPASVVGADDFTGAAPAFKVTLGTTPTFAKM